ncbi:MAG: hypothetical protein AAF648_01415 [Pseudomonadota bacterium]
MTPEGSQASDDFYIGYATSGWRGAALTIGLTFLLTAVGLGFWIASAQQGAGTGSWQPNERQTTLGVLTVDPYPVLHTLEQPSRSILLVRPGKASAAALVSPYAGQVVGVRGAPIERGGWSMLEVYDDDDLAPAESPTAVTPSAHVPELVPAEDVTLTGEIVDSKCFLGVMKPGTGKVHRACAALCLTGGMPPMLVVTDSAGDRYGYLLVNEDGSSASLRLVPDVAVPVAVTGRLETRGDLVYLRLAASAVRRI